MKLSVVIIAICAVFVTAAPLPGDVEIVHSESEVLPESFKYSFETSDGTKADAQGHLNNVGSEDESLVVTGSFSYVGDDGVTYTVTYTADENGYQPQGAHLPVAPETSS